MRVIAVLLCLVATVAAQSHTTVTKEDSQTITGAKTFTGNNTMNGTLNGTVNAATQSGADICAQTNAAIQSFSSLGGGVLVPAKTGGYSACVASIVIDRPTHLYCDGGVGTYDATTTNCAIRFAAGVRGIWVKPLAFGKVVVENLNLTSASSVLGTDDGILNQANSTNIRNVSISHFGRDGLHSDSADLGAGVGNADGGNYENVMSDNNFRYGFRSEGSDANTSTYIGTKATGNGNYGYSLTTPSNIVILSTATSNGLVAGVGDYYDGGLGNRWIYPYSEGSRGFLVDTAETDATIDVSQFGQPTFSGASMTFAHITSGPNINGNVQLCYAATYDCTVPWQFLTSAAISNHLIIKHNGTSSLDLFEGGIDMNTNVSLQGFHLFTGGAVGAQLDAGSTAAIRFNSFSGSGGVYFGNGAGVFPFIVNSNGTLTQSLGANGLDFHTATRFTDTSPTGNFLNFKNAAAASVYSVDIKGNTILTNLLISTTAPTISSGFGSSPSIATNNGTAAFTVNVGTGGTANSGVIGLPTAANGWNCYVTDITTQSTTVFLQKQTASSTSSCTVGNFNTAGAAAAFVASDILSVSAFAR